jgi:hypothetical protein
MLVAFYCDALDHDLSELGDLLGLEFCRFCEQPRCETAATKGQFNAAVESGVGVVIALKDTWPCMPGREQ